MPVFLVEDGRPSSELTFVGTALCGRPSLNSAQAATKCRPYRYLIYHFGLSDFRPFLTGFSGFLLLSVAGLFC